RVQPKATGRPGYAPGDLLKLYIYGYLNRVRSSRRLEAECHRNIEVIWLLRTLKPDFKTIPEFWGEVQPPASLKGLDIPSRRAVFVPWKPSRRPVFGMGNPTFR